MSNETLAPEAIHLDQCPREVYGLTASGCLSDLASGFPVENVEVIVACTAYPNINDIADSCGPLNQPPSSKDEGLGIGLKAGAADAVPPCRTSSHTLNPSGVSS